MSYMICLYTPFSTGKLEETSSENHRAVDIERDLLSSCHLTALLKAGPPRAGCPGPSPNICVFLLFD